MNQRLLKILAIVLAVATMATACNGHEAASHNQHIGVSLGFEHNHGENPSPQTSLFAVHTYEDALQEWSSRQCITWVFEPKASPNTSAAAGENCTGWIAHNHRTSGEVRVNSLPKITQFQISGLSGSVDDYNFVAFESRAEFRPTSWTSGVFLICEYHDANGDNGVTPGDGYCDGRDANGN